MGQCTDAANPAVEYANGTVSVSHPLCTSCLPLPLFYSNREINARVNRDPVSPRGSHASPRQDRTEAEGRPVSSGNSLQAQPDMVIYSSCQQDRRAGSPGTLNLTAYERKESTMSNCRYVPLEKRTKKQQRAHYAALRTDWNGVKPTTQVIPDKRHRGRTEAKVRVNALPLD